MTSKFPSDSAKLIEFTKMHGAGNDYVYIDCMRSMPDKPEELAVEMASRHFGVGGDGLVLICPSEVADLRMRMFNADGSEGRMCGNAARCIALYATTHGLTDSDTINLETLSGIKVLLINRDTNGGVKDITVDMGIPVTAADAIPVNSESSEMIDKAVKLSEGSVDITAVSMGNPHCVLFVPSLDVLDFFRLGPELENHPVFPDRANVEFVRVIDAGCLEVRVWERGSGETLACGTGACAAAVAGVLTGRCGREVTIHLKGGCLNVKWDEDSGHVYMTGPATEVFNGLYRRQKD